MRSEKDGIGLLAKLELLIQKAHGGLADVFITSKGEWYGKTYDM